MDHYRIKVETAGPMDDLYGVVESYSPAAKAAAEEGNVIFRDWRGKRWQVEEERVVDIPLAPLSRDAEDDEYDAFVQRKYEAARKLAEANPEDGLYKNDMLRIGVGDGYAFYVVTKVNKKTVHIEWRAFGADEYVDFRFGYGGKVDRNMVEPIVRSEKALRRIFS